jgi:hypothetical protein
LKTAEPLRIEWMPLSQATLKLWQRNPKKHDLGSIIQSIKKHGFRSPSAYDATLDGIVVGNGRIEALSRMHFQGDTPPRGILVKGEEWFVPVIHGLDSETLEQAEAWGLDENNLGLLGGDLGVESILRMYDEDQLKAILSDAAMAEEMPISLDVDDLDALLADWSPPKERTEEEQDGIPPETVKEARKLLTDIFLVPPFSTLDGKQGYWRERRELWLSMGVRSWRPPAIAYSQDMTGKANDMGGFGQTASFFDPVICELAYRWFCPPAGKVLDPFAGSSVAGIVAAVLGRSFLGIDLNEQQVVTANEQWEKLASSLFDPGTGVPRWVQGDAANVLNVVGEEKFDLLFSCPPYFDLEVYSDNPNDLSAMGSYADFLEAYFHVIRCCAKVLADDRFCVWVVSEFRDRSGMQRGFVADTIRAFQAAGMPLYNEAVHLRPQGTAPQRASKGFSVSRKLTPTHQNVLIFVKGDPKEATKILGPVQMDEILERLAAEASETEE